MNDSSETVSVAVEDVIAADPVLRELVDACGSARAALGHLQDSIGQPGARLPIALIVLGRMIDAIRRRMGRPRLGPLKCMWPDTQVMSPGQIAVHLQTWEPESAPHLVT